MGESLSVGNLAHFVEPRLLKDFLGYTFTLVNLQEMGLRGSLP